MGLIRTCPSCGFESGEIRCPRCFTLKLQGCTGACSACKSGSCEMPAGPGECKPSEQAREDAEHPGTPLTR